MRYSIAQLLDRASAGRIGRKGLHRLAVAGYDAGELAASGVDASANVPDVGQALEVRREGNFLRAIQRAQAATAAGQGIGEATRARLAQGIETAPGVRVAAPDPTTYQGDSLAKLLEHYRRRRQGALSDAGVYDL